MNSTLNKINLLLQRHAWMIDNYWLRFYPARQMVIRTIFYFRGILEKSDFARKISVINEFLDSFFSDPDKDRYFTSPGGAARHEGDEGPAAPTAGQRWSGYRVPSEAFRERLRHHIMKFSLRDEERSFKLSDLITLEKEMIENRKKTGHNHRVFTKERRTAFRLLAGPECEELDLPESYIMYYFPSFDPSEFVRNGARFLLGRRRLFRPEEMMAAIAFFADRLRMRNPHNPYHRAVPILKKAVIIILILFYGALILFDLSVLVYGLSKNEYYYTFSSLGQTITTCDTPYARRAERLYRRNHSARFDDFTDSEGNPPPGNSYRIDNGAQIAVELNYDSYRSLRIQDQNGLMIVAVDRKKIGDLARSDPHRHRRLMGLMIEKRWWESALLLIDEISGGSLHFFDFGSISHERVCDDMTKNLMKSVRPLDLIGRINAVADVVSMIYYKPNSMKWASLDEIPPVMTEGVILREDRRFRNRLFPVPHRGNDNLVIIPQITKKVFRRMFGYLRSISSQYHISWLERQSNRYESGFNASFKDDNRGGSSISNQVMEMLYTKFITVISRRPNFSDRQIEQKEHELPASVTVDWFWSRNDILEAYVNEVYGGHLSSDIRGFKSQAEMYFMRDLDRLNLREQVMLVAAIKKPSRIKEYASWLKADELRVLLETPGVTRKAVAQWEDDNASYKVDRNNYREILSAKLKAKTWLEGRMFNILRLLRGEGVISADEERIARRRQKVSFCFAPGIVSAESRLANNIKRELDRELGVDRSDSGLVVVTTIEMGAQKKLQTIIDRRSRWISVDSDYRVEGQPENVMLEGGGRIILAHTNARSGKPQIVNRIIADVGGTTHEEDEWDWVSLANRSLGSSLKPILDMYFLLSGYNLHDMFKNSLVTYKTYSLEQQKIFQNFIHKYPKRVKEIEGIEKYWSWSPRNFTEYTNDWITVEDALIHSINGIHVQIQELVTPATFARLLNETMNITDPEGKHQPFRSIILGGSSGDQRYDRYLLAYSLFPNLGVLKKHTFIETVRRPDHSIMKPAYRQLKSSLLERQGADRVRAACVLIDLALRETVRRGTMAGMEGIGAGKTGTSNELRDVMATVHFIAGDSTYIAGVRLGNRRNYSIGRAADRIAVPLLHDIVTGTLDRSSIMSGEDYDGYLRRLAESSPEIVCEKEQYILKGNPRTSRRLEVVQAQEEIRKKHLVKADAYYGDRDYIEAARSYEDFLALADEFNSRHPAFERMVHCYVEVGNLKRAAQLIERFSLPGKIWRTARAYEKKYDVTLKVDEDFYSGDNEFERRKHEKGSRKSRSTTKETGKKVNADITDAKEKPESDEKSPPEKIKEDSPEGRSKTQESDTGDESSP